MNTIKSYKSESGNILIYILGAIFLIGALTLMVKGSSAPGAGIDEETAIIRLSEVQDYGRELETAISYIFQNGHSESDIRFAHPDADSAYGVITDIPTRQVFHRNGGGATYRDPPRAVQTIPTDWIFTGANHVWGVGSTCPASNCSELTAILGNVKKEFCNIVNEKNNIKTSTGDPPQDDGNVNNTTLFVGNFISDKTIRDTTSFLNGKQEGCFEGDNTPPAGTYHYYRVLLPR